MAMSEAEWRRAVVDVLDDLLSEIPREIDSEGYSQGRSRTIAAKIRDLYTDALAAEEG